MGLFDAKKQAQALPPEVEACDRELASLEQRKIDVHRNIGQHYAAQYTVAEAAGTIFEADLLELEKIKGRQELLEKRRLAVQGQRKCEKCGGILSMDSVFCNKCGEKLLPIEPEVLTDGPLCPQCKSPIEPGVAFCTKCGAKLDNMPVNEESPASELKCPNCGVVCEPGTKFCIKCGQKLGE